MSRVPHNPVEARAIPPVSLRHDIACNPDNATAFHNDLGYSSYVMAARICARCPAQAECLEWALDTRQQHGFWGGMTAIEREAELRERRRQAVQDHLLASTRPE